jgi:invasion protein IalB
MLAAMLAIQLLRTALSGALRTALPLALLGTASSAAALSARETDYQDWRVRCETPDDGGGEQCVMFQSVTAAERDARILNVAVRYVSDDPAPIAYVAAPLGVYLPSGLAMTIDDGNPLRLPFEFCNASGCHTRLKLEGDLLQSLKQGGSAQFVIVQFTGGKQFTANVSLRGFTAAFNALK